MIFDTMLKAAGTFKLSQKMVCARPVVGWRPAQGGSLPRAHWPQDRLRVPAP